MSRSARRRTRRSSPRCSRRTRPTRSRTRSRTSCRGLEGGFSTVVMTADRVVAFRDPAGLRPLALGPARGALLRRLGVLRVRHHGVAVPARDPARRDGGRSPSAGFETRQVVTGDRRAFCVFEHVYFARPDSRLGRPQRADLARAHRRRSPLEAPVRPTSWCRCPTAARRRPRLRRASRAPADDGLIKNRYVGRTFIEPEPEDAQARRADEVQPAPRGRRRQAPGRGGRLDRARHTTRKIVGMIREAGAAEVHIRISAPPIRALPLRDRHPARARR